MLVKVHTEMIKGETACVDYNQKQKLWIHF